MKPQWQKAILKQRPALFPHVQGREVWVDASGPCSDAGPIQIINSDGEPVGPVRYYENPIRSNIIDSIMGHEYRLQIPLAAIELLCEFSETVEMVKWEDFIK